jgi:hypothetical protein
LVSRLGELGPKWIAITQYLPTRSINDLKNRYHLLQRQNSLFRRRKSYPAPRGHPAPKHAVKHETPSGPVDPCQFMERFRQEFEWESGSVDSAWDLSGRSLQ